MLTRVSHDDVFRCVSSSQGLSFHKVITSPFPLTFFDGKESYKETASLLKKDCCLLPSLNSFFKGDGCANESFSKVEMENVMIVYAIINILPRPYPFSSKLSSAFHAFLRSYPRAAGDWRIRAM